MRFSSIFFLILFLVVTMPLAALSAPPKMRPYTGIGILMFPHVSDELRVPLPIYEDPGLSRLDSLSLDRIPKYEWIFGASTTAVPLIVTERKGSWLRVAYDDAGREAWLKPVRSVPLQSWDFFLKDHICKLLPGLQKKYYQFYQHPGKAALIPLTTRQFFKVLRLENEWAMVLTDENSLGWLRWRDEDGRLLIGVSPVSRVMQP
jgi:hypothetical protein